MQNKVYVYIVLVFVFFLLAADVGAAGLQSNTLSGAVLSPSGSMTKPLADVAIKAAEVDKLLSTLADKLTPSLTIGTIRSSLPDISAQVDRDLEETKRVLSHRPFLPVLQDQQQKWQRTQFVLFGWLDISTERSGAIQNTLIHLENLEKIWAVTLADARTSAAPGLILVKIEKTVIAIHDTQAGLKEQLVLVFDLQNQIDREIARCGNTLQRIADRQQTTMSEILVQDSLPVWSSKLWTAESNSLANLHSAVTVYVEDLKISLIKSSRYIPLLAANFAVLLLLLAAARIQTRKWTGSGEEFSPFFKVFDYPVAAALTVFLLVVTAPYHSPLPASLRYTLQVLVLAPVLILIRPEIPACFRPLFYGIAFLFILDVIRDILFAEQPLGQILLIFESVAGMALMIRFRRNTRISPTYMTGSTALHTLQLLVFLVLLLFTAGFAATVSGHSRLGHIIVPGVLSFFVMAIAMFVAFRVFVGIVTLAFQVWPLNILHMVQHHRPLLEKRIHRILFLAVATGWILRHLSYIGLLEPVLGASANFFTTRLIFGTLSISLADVIFFVLTVWAAYQLSSFIRFILSEDVYPRIRVARGKSFAVSSLLHYLILGIGFTAAIGVLGVDLTKFSVLTGALGIGIGFGLQGVVNNFVSGLMLLFERPIQVGDTVEVGSLLGKVRKIGIRASTVRTRQGADIIVPNSQLVSEKVTNWTFGDKMKRIDLPVGVNYNSSPQSVTELLSTVARAHPHVLQNPPPQGLVIGFGDSSINFELRVWTEHIDEWALIRSELATAVFDGVRKAGMTFPFPQREVRLLNDTGGNDAAVFLQQDKGKKQI